MMPVPMIAMIVNAGHPLPWFVCCGINEAVAHFGATRTLPRITLIQACIGKTPGLQLLPS